MRYAEQSTDSNRRQGVIPYRRFVVLGLLGLNSLLLQQFLTLSRDYLSSRSNDRDIGVTIPGFDLPTTQFVICALAISIPCLTILGAHYTFTYQSAFLPRGIEYLFWMLGVTGAGLALIGTFWFISPLSSVVFLASIVLFYILYVISARAKKPQVVRESGGTGRNG